MQTVELPSIPGPLEWVGTPVEWQVANDQALHITAGAQTDLFIDPQGSVQQHSSPRLVFEPGEHFTLSARVQVNFNSTFDAGVLLLYVDDTHWAKLCFEYSPQQQPMIVSVVTHGVSDDCNSVALDTNTVYLRITKLERAFAFHYSEDGQKWPLVRYFALPKTARLVAGFSSQSPTGTACRAIFDRIAYRPESVGDIRSGE